MTNFIPLLVVIALAVIVGTALNHGIELMSVQEDSRKNLLGKVLVAAALGVVLVICLLLVLSFW